MRRIRGLPVRLLNRCLGWVLLLARCLRSERLLAVLLLAVLLLGVRLSGVLLLPVLLFAVRLLGIRLLGVRLPCVGRWERRRWRGGLLPGGRLLLWRPEVRRI